MTNRKKIDTGAARLPALARVNVQDKALSNWMQAVTEHLEVRAGGRGNEFERGVTLRELNDLCKKVLAEGMTAIGKIQSAEEIGKYYMHGVSHHLGLDTHDCAVREDLGLRAGMVISDEPGLYIDEEEIGIRIEDDLLITDTGCRVLSEAIPRTTEEIEALMAR